MVVKIDQSDCAIGGLVNLLENPIDKIPTQTCFYVIHVVFTHIVLHICMLFMFHITCTPAHINIHGISRLHNLGVGRYMIYMSLGHVNHVATYTSVCNLYINSLRQYIPRSIKYMQCAAKKKEGDK